MPKKSKKQKQPLKIRLGNHELALTKPRLELIVLIFLVVSVIVAQVSGFYPYTYNYARCGDAPLEVRKPYYRIPTDNGYGIHIGSDYSRCFDRFPTDLQRDPTTRIGAKLLKASKDKTDFTHGVDGYTVYTPKGYPIAHLGKSGQPGYVETTYTTSSGDVQFRVREMKKDSIMSYTNLCDKPPEDGWSGEVTGKDTEGRKICRAHMPHEQEYIVGVNIGNTAIMLQARLDKSEAELNAAATTLFSAIQPYSK